LAKGAQFHFLKIYMKTILMRWARVLSLLLVSTLLSSTSTLRAQNTVIAYRGLVTSSGANFSGLGQFKFVLVTSTNAAAQATATATTSGGFLTIISVAFGGSGYSTPPVVTITGGGGSGGTATANVSGGVVTSITVNNPGTGYTSTPTITIAPPPSNISFTTFWSNDDTSVAGGEPSTAVSAPVSNGLFTVNRSTMVRMGSRY
jgi:hypothetical protein